MFGYGASATCFHPGARSDPRVQESQPDDDGQPKELFLVGHADTGNARVQNFILAALNLLGDTDGDGDVDANDLVAEAGGDFTAECTGATTTFVTLDATRFVHRKHRGALVPLERAVRLRRRRYR